MMNRDMPKILQLLQEENKLAVRPRGQTPLFSLYTVDLSEWRLSFSDDTPFIVVQADDVRANPNEVWVEIGELIRARDWELLVPIIIVDGKDDFIKQKIAVMRESRFPMAVLDDRVLENARLTRSLRYAIEGELMSQIPRSKLLPYQTEAPVTGSRFFDRQSQLNQLLGTDHSCALIGIRRIGKTSLLVEAYRRLQDKEVCVFIPCGTIHSQAEFQRELIRNLRKEDLRQMDHKLFHFPDYLVRMTKYKQGRITLFLDEVDELVAVDQRSGYAVMSALRDARTATKGKWRFIFTGATTLADDCNSRTSPLYNMLKVIELKPFTRDQAQSLICDPFQTVRIDIRNRNEVVARIYDETAGHPNLIQYYCVLLAGLVDQERRDYVEVGDLTRVYEDEAFRTYVVRSFNQNTDVMGRLIVYSMLDSLDFTQGDIDAVLKRRGVASSYLELDEACRRLTLAAVLVKRGHVYNFALPLLPMLIQEINEPEYLIMKAKEELSQ